MERYVSYTFWLKQTDNSISTMEEDWVDIMEKKRNERNAMKEKKKVCVQEYAGNAS